ncbi:MAG: hypothetical protein WD153_02320 [Candidatus Paceibacterota bacterium]
MSEDEIPSDDSLHKSALAQWAIAKIQGFKIKDFFTEYLKQKYPKMSEVQHARVLSFMLSVAERLDKPDTLQQQTPAKTGWNWTSKQIKDAKAHEEFHKRCLGDNY